MKFLTHNNDTQASRPWVYLSAQVNLESSDDSEPEYNGPVAGSFLGSLQPRLKAANDNSPILRTDQEAGSGIHVADTVENFDNRINEVIDQGTDGAISAGLGGKFLSKIFTPPEFQGYTNLYLLNPFFAAPAGFTPASVITRQLREGFDSLGDPAELLGDSPLLSIKMAKALVKKEEINASIDGARSGGGHLDAMSLTSLQILEKVNDSAFEAVNKTNENRAAEFYAKSGYDINTGERDEATGAVWWKRALRIGLGQNFLYRRRVKWAKSRYQEGHDEIRSNIRSLKRSKEEAVFGMQQSIDQFLIPKTAEGSADTIGLDEGRRVLHRIINAPESFLQNPGSFNEPNVSVADIFGTNFKAIDVLEALRSPKYEYLTNQADAPNYLDSAITTGQWQFNHYNALRTLRGINNRAEALNNFSGTSLERLEQYITQHYEPSGEKIDLDNLGPLVGEIIEAIGASGKNLSHDINRIVQNGDIYSSADELFWHLVSFLGKDDSLATFKQLPPALQGKLAEFFLQKRTQLEKNAVSGGIEERGSLIWRVEALRQGKIIADNTEALASELPDLAKKLISTNKGEAQAALRSIKTLTDSYNFFLDLVGIPTKEDGTIDKAQADSLLSGLPEFEQSILSNVIDLYPKIKTLYGVYTKLQEERKDVEKLMDQDPEKIAELEAEYQRKNKEFESSKESGLAGMGHVLDFNSGGAAGGNNTGAGGTGGGDIETYYTALRLRLKEIQDVLYGQADSQDGGAYGKMAKIENFTFNNLPGDISPGLGRVAEINRRSIERRLKEMGLDSDEKIAELLDGDKKPSFDVLARNELWNTASRSIVQTAEGLLGNDTAQQFENMERTAYVGLQTISYAPAKYQSKLTVESLRNPETLTDALYVRKYNDGYLYHTETQIILVNPPRLNSPDQRNVAVWNKSPEEKGLDKKFTMPYTQPDQLGIFITANPENSAASANTLYGPVQQKVDALIADNKNKAPLRLVN